MSTGGLTDALRETLALFEEGVPLTTSEAASRLDLGRRSTYERLDRLVDRGVLETKKVGSNGRVWWRPRGATTDEPAGATGVAARQFGRLVEAIDEYAIVALDAEGRVVTWNEGAAEITGYDDEDALGEHVRTFYVDDEREAGVPERDLAAAAAEGSIESEGWRVRADGSRFRAHTSIVAVPGEAGALDGFVTVTRDVTDRRERERVICRQRDELEAELEDVYDRITDGFYGLDEDLRFTYLNDRAEGLLGLDAASAIGTDVREVLDLTERFESALLEAIEEGMPVFVEDYYEPLDAWFENALYPSETGVSVYFRDVSERKEREEELERYEAIVEAIGDPVYALDAEGRFTFVNGALADRSGYDESELLGEPVSVGVEPAAIDRTAAAIAGLYAEDPDGSIRVEFEVVGRDGERIPVENHISLLVDEAGAFRGSAGVLRDVSDRKARERRLEESRNRYRTLVENFPNGTVTLVDRDLRYVAIGGSLIEEPEELEGGDLREVLHPELADALVPRYREALEGERSTFEREIGDGFYQFRILPVENDDGEVLAAMGMSQDVTDRVEHHRALERQRERLTALDELNGVFRDVTEAVIDQSTRGEIESIVCERLAEADSYRFAWIGDVDVPAQTVNLRTEAGVEGYLDGTTISVDPDDERSRGPTGQAVLHREVQTIRDVQSDARHDPWRDHVGEHEFRSSAAVPIVHDDTLYGVLNVYAGRPRAFEGDEREVIGALGEVVGHAIAAVEQKRALVSDEMIEVEFRIPDATAEFDIPPDREGELVFERTVPLGGDEYLAYGYADDDMVPVLHALAETFDTWETVRPLGAGDPGGRHQFELQMVDPPLVSAVTSLGGYLDRTMVRGGDHYVRMHLAPSANVRRLIDFVRDLYPSARLVTRQQVARDPDPPVPFSRVLERRLTDRQRAALVSAYFAGYFDWPRDSKGEEVAASMGVSGATFHQHLRAAQRKLLRVALEETA